MGTVTAIGEYDPNRNGTAYLYNTSTGSMTTYWGSRGSIAFDTWELAVSAALTTARTYRHVKVNKIGGEWVVSWDAPVLSNPTYPTNPQPWWQNPYTVTWDNGIGTVRRDNTA